MESRHSQSDSASLSLLKFSNEGICWPCAASAKSSIGRLDLLTRIITDHGVEFDRVPDGYNGPLYVEICPRSFSVVVQPGQMVNQIIFRLGQTVISDADLRLRHAATPIVSGNAVISDGLGFSVDLLGSSRGRRAPTGDYMWRD